MTWKLTVALTVAAGSPP